MSIELIMLRGLPASGKTTLAKKLVNKGFVRVNKDDLRAMMDNSCFSKANERRVLEVRDFIVENALENKVSVVVDDTNFAPKHKERLEQLAIRHGADFRELTMDTPLDECIKRNENRENKVPEKVIRDMNEKYLTTIPLIPHNDDLEECIIVDVDGTLAHMTGRNPYDASRAMEDTLDDAVSNIVAMSYANGYKVIILTGRSKNHLQVTEDWLKANGVNYDEIYCRAFQDNRADTIVKQELYEAHIKDKYNVKFILDDRNSVVEMWRSLGLKCLQAQLGDF